jgi:hypothetical protein
LTSFWAGFVADLFPEGMAGFIAGPLPSVRRGLPLHTQLWIARSCANLARSWFKGASFRQSGILSAPGKANAPRATAFGLANRLPNIDVDLAGPPSADHRASPWSFAYIAGLAARLP